MIAWLLIFAICAVIFGLAVETRTGKNDGYVHWLALVLFVLASIAAGAVIALAAVYPY